MENLFISNLSQYNKVCGIYLLKIDIHLYVGSAINLNLRLRSHKNCLSRDNHRNPYLQHCFNKYGKEHCLYSILEYCSKDNRLEKEKVWIEKLRADLNLIKDPTTQNNCVTTSKRVYQYTLKGNFIDEYPSAQEAGRCLNLDGHVIAKCCLGKYGHKSYNKSIWSYTKFDKLPEYTNNSAKAKNKAVTMYDKFGIKLESFSSIAAAARYLQEPSDNFGGLCANISSVCNGRGMYVKSKYRFTYIGHNLKSFSRNYPIIQVLSNGTEKLWESTSIAAKQLGISAGGIRKVLRGERKKYVNCMWKLQRV